MNPDALNNEQAISNQPTGAIAVNENHNPFGQSKSVNLTIVDSAVDDIDSLISQVSQNSQVLVLDSNSDGISQITDALSQLENVASLNVVSHGDAGQLQLGSSTISYADLAEYSSQLQSWQDSLTADADILFYGCNVAAGDRGSQFLSEIGELTGADIAASTDLTGSSQLGGDWHLEYSSGDIESVSPFAESIAQTYQSVLNSQTLFSDGNESGLDNYRIDSQTNHGVTTVDNPDGAGSVLKFDLRIDDQLSNNKHRAEVRPKVDTPIQFGENYTYSFRTYFPENWQTDNSGEIVAQWHGIPDKHLGENYRNPPAALRVLGDSFNLRQAWDADAVTDTRDKTSHGWSSTDLGELKRGEWINWTFEIKWSYKSDGVFKVYQDGNLVFDRSGPNTFNDEIAPYAKLGIYKPDWTARPETSSTTQRVFYADDYTIQTGHTTNPVSAQSLPTANDDAFTTAEDTQVTGNVLTGAGADDAGSGSLTLIDHTQPANGSLSIQDNGNFTYSPKADFFGTDTFTYTVQNSNGGTDTATVTLTVNEVNDRPTSTGRISNQASSDGNRVSLDVSSYFTDSDGTIASYSIEGLPEGLSIGADGVISGTISSDASNPSDINASSHDYTVTVEATDNDGATVNQSFIYTVNNINPIAKDDVFTTDENASLSGNVLGGDSDGGTDTDSLSIISYSEPNHGTVSIQTDGTFTYTPDTSFAGTDTFTYTVSDGNGGIDTATVTVTVNDIPDPTSPDTFRVEAESLVLDTYRLESKSIASGGKLISLRGKKGNEVGSATYIHSGNSGTFDIDLRYFDENDGQSTIKVKLNGQQIDQWSLNADPAGSNASESSSRIYTLEGIALSEGDRLEIVGLENKSEHVRIDYLDFKAVAPAPSPIRVEAEDLLTNNYRTETYSYASGGKVLGLRGTKSGEVGEAVYVHQGGASTFDLNLSYFDENDGVSTIRILLNGKEVDSWLLDEDPDGAPVSAATERVRTIEGLELQEGDRITIIARENAGEHVRIDYLELIPSLAAPLDA